MGNTNVKPKTPHKPKTPRKVGDVIKCYILDEDIRLAHNKKAVYSQTPSIWEYNPKGGVPTELANLDSSTFLISRHGQILCSLPRDVFVRICFMLSALDFLNLSSTCRFLHWRMYTFCTCNTPYTVRVSIEDDRLFGDFWNKDGLPKWIYTLNNEQRGHFVYEPFCLRKPFFFEMLELQLWFPFFDKKYYDMCLPYILAIRGLARGLYIKFINKDYPPEKAFFNFSDTNDFLMATNASYFKYMGKDDDGTSYSINNFDIYINCPYARQMDRVFITNQCSRDTINVPVFQNSIGIYRCPLDGAVVATLDNFLADSPKLIFHQYMKIEKENDGFPLIEYLFEKFGDFEEFYCGEIDGDGFYYYHTWKKIVATENGGQIRIMIEKMRYGHVTIGKEEMFDEMNKKYAVGPPFQEGDIWWKMETAVEPDEDEYSGEVEEE